jgi:hypothetical protein
MRLTIPLASAAAVILASPVLSQASCPLGTCSPRIAVAMPGTWEPSLLLGVFWTKTLTPAPPVMPPGAGPAPIVESRWSLRALVSAGLTFAEPRRYAVDVTGLGFFGVMRDIELGPINRAGATIVGSVNPNAAGVAARVEAIARVAGIQVGWVRLYEDDTHRMFGMLDMSFAFVACDILQRCGAADDR